MGECAEFGRRVRGDVEHEAGEEHGPSDEADEMRELLVGKVDQHAVDVRQLAARKRSLAAPTAGLDVGYR